MIRKIQVANSEPKLDRKDYEHLVNSIETLYNWYRDGIATIGEDLLTVVSILVKHFSYEPYGGSLYRAVPIVNPPFRFKVNDTIRMKVSPKHYQSWTTSAKAARMFGQKTYRDYVIVELKDAAHEILNYRWLHDIVDKLSSLPNVDQWRNLRYWSKRLLELLVLYKDEDEVIIKATPEMRVKVLAIIN
jgi:hypothetical protein